MIRPTSISSKKLSESSWTWSYIADCSLRKMRVPIQAVSSCCAICDVICVSANTTIMPAYSSTLPVSPRIAALVMKPMSNGWMNWLSAVMISKTSEPMACSFHSFI